MFAQMLGNVVLVSTSTVAALMVLSLVIAGIVGYRLANRRIEILEVDGTPSPSTGTTADSNSGAGGLSFCKNVTLGR